MKGNLKQRAHSSDAEWDNNSSLEFVDPQLDTLDDEGSTGPSFRQQTNLENPHVRKEQVPASLTATYQNPDPGHSLAALANGSSSSWDDDRHSLQSENKSPREGVVSGW